MVVCTKPQRGKKEESERLRGEGNRIKFIYLRFERVQVVGFGKGTALKYNMNRCARSQDGSHT